MCRTRSNHDKWETKVNSSLLSTLIFLRAAGRKAFPLAPCHCLSRQENLRVEYQFKKEKKRKAIKKTDVQRRRPLNSDCTDHRNEAVKSFSLRFFFPKYMFLPYLFKCLSIVTDFAVTSRIFESSNVHVVFLLITRLYNIEYKITQHGQMRLIS